MKTILCIDTISSAAGITIVHDDLAYHLSLNPQMASEGIIDLIDKAMKEVKIGVSDLHGVMVIKGPGSFTGLRVGISVTNQFSHQLKIPMLGLKTDEWWKLRTNEANPLYIQSMNKEEVYISDEHGEKIITTEELKSLGEKKWLGELKFDHLEKLPKDFEEIKELESIENTWKKAIKVFESEMVKKNSYELVEPFYGKDAKITQPKNS